MPSAMSPVFTPQEIAERVAQLGARISLEYADKDLLLVGVLKGAFVFLADLARSLTIPAQVDFVRLSSYQDKDHPGELVFSRDLELDPRGRHVLVIEDIVDTGRSMSKLMASLAGRGAESVRLCALIDKTERREVHVEVDFSGFRLSQGFLVGYGLDFAENHRCLPGVYKLLNPKDA